MSFYSVPFILEYIRVSVSHHKTGRIIADKTFAKVLVLFFDVGRNINKNKTDSVHMPLTVWDIAVLYTRTHL